MIYSLQSAETNCSPRSRQYRQPNLSMHSSRGRSWNELEHRWKKHWDLSSPLGELVSRCLDFFFSPFLRIMYLCRWIVCARWPWLMIFLGISVAAALTAGVIFLKVTIDPVELWAAPESRSRLEKDYFDENFTPFYRTEQVILHAENYDGEHGTVSCDNRNQNKSDTDTKKTSSFFHTSLNMKRCRESKHLDRHFDLTSFW